MRLKHALSARMTACVLRLHTPKTNFLLSARLNLSYDDLVLIRERYTRRLNTVNKRNS
jgi:hypothetical protein